MTQRTPERSSVHPRHVSRCQMLGYFGGKAYGRQCLVKQSWEMGEICPKTKSYPPLTKQKLISTHPHIMKIFRLNPPPPPLQKVSSHRFPHNQFTCWISSFGTNITSNDSSTYVEESFEESSESLDSGLVSSSHELRILSDGAFFEAQFHHIVFYLPYFKFISLLINKVSTVGFFILLNYDAMCANNGIFLFH